MNKTETSTQYIQRLIAEGEHCHQDFKFEISDARKIARSISAFANTGGGRLLVGVKDNGKIAGIRSEEEIYMIEAAANMYCKPTVELHTHTYHVVFCHNVLCFVVVRHNPVVSATCCQRVHNGTSMHVH